MQRSISRRITRSISCEVPASIVPRDQARSSSPTSVRTELRGVASSCAAPAPRASSAVSRSLRSTCARAASSSRSRCASASDTRPTKYAINAAAADNATHMPPRCSVSAYWLVLGSVNSSGRYQKKVSAYAPIDTNEMASAQRWPSVTAASVMPTR